MMMPLSLCPTAASEARHDYEVRTTLTRLRKVE